MTLASDGRDILLLGGGIFPTPAMERKEGLLGRGKVFPDIGEHTVKMALTVFLKASGKAVNKREKSRGGTSAASRRLKVGKRGILASPGPPSKLQPHGLYFQDFRRSGAPRTSLWRGRERKRRGKNEKE